MLAVWQRADEEAEAAKDGYFAIKLLTEFYGDLNEEERQFANEVIQDWLISPDAKMRFDAVALAHTFRILELIPTLKDLAVMLSARDGAAAREERKTVLRIIDKLRVPE
jgi:hypothetical protein